MYESGLSVVQSELERAFEHFNKELFHDELQPCMVTLQKNSRANWLGWATTDKVWVNHKPENNRIEINICPHILHQPMDIIFEVLLHEMVHAFNAQKGIRDCSNGQYHNRKFRDKAKDVGLLVEKSGNRGWAFTEIAKGGIAEKSLQNFNPQKEVFAFARGHFVYTKGVPSENPPKSSSKLKRWSCGCQNARVAIKDFQATCKKCGNDFQRMDLI